MGLAFMSHCYFSFFLCEKRAFMAWWDLVMAVCNLSFSFSFFFFFPDENSILYNILLLFGDPLISGGIRWWPKWPTASADTACCILFFGKIYLEARAKFSSFALDTIIISFYLRGTFQSESNACLFFFFLVEWVKCMPY